MAEKPADVPQGWLVRVNFHAIAAYLSKRRKRKADIIDAAVWLCGKSSPFTKTSKYAVFYTNEDPRQWLDDEEIINIWPTPRWTRRRGGKLTPPPTPSPP